MGGVLHGVLCISGDCIGTGGGDAHLLNEIENIITQIKYISNKKTAGSQIRAKASALEDEKDAGYIANVETKNYKVCHITKQQKIMVKKLLKQMKYLKKPTICVTMVGNIANVINVACNDTNYFKLRSKFGEIGAK